MTNPGKCHKIRKLQKLFIANDANEKWEKCIQIRY